MKKIFLGFALVLIFSSLLFTSCTKEKENITIEEEKIQGTWSGDYESSGVLEIKFKGSAFNAVISLNKGSALEPYEKIDGNYNLYGNLLKLYVKSVSRKDDGGWASFSYNETIEVRLTFANDNTVTAKWGKNQSVTVKRH